MPERLKHIEKMLMEMSTGNFFYRVERSVKNDNVEALVVVLNMMAEEIQEAMVHQGYVQAHGTIKHIVQMSFILDDKGHIQATNQRTCSILSTLYSEIIEKPFAVFLDESSKVKWQNTWKTLKQKGIYENSVELAFKTKSNLVVPSVCYITTFKVEHSEPKKTLITVVHHSNDRDRLEKELKRSVTKSKKKKGSKNSLPKKPKIRLSFEDIKKLRKGRDIIINNLEKDFPSLKDFALQIGTNEFKLKYGFKELYGTSVYRFLKNERLRKSKMLVQYSDLHIKTIAHMIGFKSVPHFSRSFKKRYGFTPSALRKKSI
ncbi:helix-turn-helix domain-containing protein [Marixanthomonas ophiurae]|uniref:Helix-turn-helix domain-containing protein n=1 Tax=Marixanthomonas ophiurae TaxID=387659 RepID=A0A3E1QDX8_9FLAO|nr:helix-turn-helix domain-containing protein [Marixanthomonas ophiurae]RFN60332.1 helix-turn-helix domain-containing protein [Marixanthomonas ophiurae]